MLPFADHSADGSRGYFCNGLRQEIIHALASLESLRVLAWDPAEPAQAADPRQAVDALHAAMAVTGSVRTSADVIRVTANLVDGASGCYLWSETLDFTTCDFAAQEAIAQAVVAEAPAWVRRAAEPEAAVRWTTWRRAICICRGAIT